MRTLSSLVVLVVLLSGCASSAEWTALTPPSGNGGVSKDGQYIVHAKSGDNCTGPMVISEYLATVKNGALTQLTRVSGANAAAGTCGMVITGVAKGLIPSVLGYIASMDHNEAIREDTKARTDIAMNSKGGPSNLIVIENQTDVYLDQRACKGDCDL